jgi:hypothetical protein
VTDELFQLRGASARRHGAEPTNRRGSLEIVRCIEERALGLGTRVAEVREQRGGGSGALSPERPAVGHGVHVPCFAAR